MLKIKIITGIEVCRKLWKEFSPQKTIFELWEFRLCFWKIYKFKPHFIVLKNGEKNVGLLPLWYNRRKKIYYFFGDIGDDFDWQEDNMFWVKKKTYIKELLRNCPSPVVLNNLTKECVKQTGRVRNIKINTPKYILSLNKIRSIENYLKTLNRKKRSNVKRDKKNIEYQNPEIITNRFSDFSTLIKIIKKKFSDAPFRDRRLMKVFLKILKLKKTRIRSRMLTVEIDQNIAGIDFILIFNKIYYPILCANNTREYPGIGNFLNLLDIEDALKLKMKKIDFLQGDSYKEKMFAKIPQYIYSK